ncbi:MAG: HPr kinase/phosphorylase [Rhodospirillales bacterium]
MLVLSSNFPALKDTMTVNGTMTLHGTRIQASQIHGTCVAIDETAVAFLGPSGSGKSDLALRLIDEGATLIADDRIDISVEGNTLIASAPHNIAGLLEVRGLGISRIHFKQKGSIALAFQMTPLKKIDRLPQSAFWEALDLQIPLIALDPFAASACAKVRLAVRDFKQPVFIETD